MSKFARRVDQLDAICLDEELSNLLNTHYRQAFKYLPNSFTTRLGPEFDILFRFCFKYLPLRYLGGTFGQNLFQLQYRNTNNNNPATNNELRILAFFSICVPWLWERLVRKSLLSLPNTEFGMSIVDASYNFENNFNIVYKMLTLLNFSIFLQKSYYPSVLERLLRLRPLYTAPQDIRRVMDDNVHREMLWYGLAEFLGFIMPLINIHKIKGHFKRTFLSRSSNHVYRRLHMQLNECMICGDIPNFPHTIGCSHVFCYYCIASIVMADPSYLCFDCDVKANGLDSITPLSANESFK
ncbi:peroxisome biogenesis factor 2 [Parasteatoda tepidariorum]|uniref:peroxisome biogenesis factor 2 n=1 Tax=Parasteatoda tepidariorum TaxID=114398 RepID=UPI00077FBF2A|nr:peroxisome biogenesis factor 2 [Parasteatoda tepidariorum]